jgi:hypothetical protein
VVRSRSKRDLAYLTFTPPAYPFHAAAFAPRPVPQFYRLCPSLITSSILPNPIHVSADATLRLNVK